MSRFFNWLMQIFQYYLQLQNYSLKQIVDFFDLMDPRREYFQRTCLRDN